MTNGNKKNEDIEYKESNSKTSPKKTFVQKGMDFWFLDPHNLKWFRRGLLSVSIIMWGLFPYLVWFTMKRATVTGNDYLWIFSLLIAYGFMAAINALAQVLKFTKYLGK